MHSNFHDLGIEPNERSEILESVLEAIGVPFVVVDGALRLMFFSARTASLFSLGLGDIGRPLNRAVPEDDGVVASVTTALRVGEVTFERVSFDDGSEYCRRTQPLQTEEESVAGAVVTYIPCP